MSRPVKRLVWVSLIIVGLIAAFVWRQSSQKPPAYATEVAAQRDVEQVVLAGGVLSAVRQVSVGAQVSGQLKSVSVALGDRVERGQLIAEIDDLPQQNALRTAQAELAMRRAELESRTATVQRDELAYQRQVRMAANDATSRAELEQAAAQRSVSRAEQAVARAQINQAETQVENAKVDLGYTRILSPIDGIIVAVVSKEGQTLSAVQMAPTIVKVAQTDQMTVKAEISEADITRVKPGLPVYFNILGEPDRRYEARLRAVEPAPESEQKEDAASSSMGASTTGTSQAVYYNGLFEIDNPDNVLRIAMTAQVFIVLDRIENALAIPASALGARAEDGTYTVRILGADGQAQDRRVKIGLNNNVDAQVLDGLQAGDRVIVAGAPKTDDGTTQ